MITKEIAFVAILISSALNSFAQQVKFVGNADKKFDGSKIVLYNHATGDHDSAYLKDGTFTLTVNFKEPTQYNFYSEYESKTKGGYIPLSILVVEPGIVKVNADIESFSGSEVSGAKENELFGDFRAKSAEAQNKTFNDLIKKYGEDFVKNRNPDTSDSKYKQMMQDYSEMSDASQKADIERLKQFVKSNPGSFAAVFLLGRYAHSMDLADLESLYAALPAKYKQTRDGASIPKTINARKSTAIGKIAPDFSQPDTLGNMVKLSDFRGKYVLIDFWGSWCVPCRAENPNVVKAFNKYRDKGLTILGVALETKKDAWLNAIHKDELVWTHVSDLKSWNNEAAALYGIKAVPANLLIDREGKIIGIDLRGTDLQNKLSELLDN